MAEISNTTLAILIIAALVVVAAGTFMNLTGFSTSDTGFVNLTVGSSLNIQVDPTNKTINFGTCTPRAATSYWCATNDTSVCDGTVASNCTGDNVTPQFIRLDNVGNIDANVTVNSSCNAAQLIGGTSPLLQFISTQCNGTGKAVWTDLGATTNACTNLSFLGGKMRLYSNATIPNDATGGCSNQATLTFSATASP